MDIDTIIGDLNKIVRYREPSDLAEAAAVASRLLEQPRYDPQKGSPLEMLANDIRVAVARLPTDLQRHAKGLLPIAKPRASIAARQRYLNISEYSGPAAKWHRLAILGRVAYELLALYGEQPCYRMQTVDLVVHHEVYGGAFGSLSGGFSYSRDLIFTWTFEPLITDMRVFAFRYATDKQLKYVGFRPLGTQQTTAVRVPISGSDDSHWYVLLLDDSPPFGAPVTLSACISYEKADKASACIDYTPEVPIGHLSLSIDTPKEQAAKCVTWRDDEPNKILKEYKGKRDEEIRDDNGVVERFPTSHFRVRSPEIGRRYSLVW